MKRFVPELPLYIDDALLVSSVGFDAATSAASMRAGLSRTAPLYGFSVTAEDGDEMEVTGHPISLLTQGFEGAGRYRQLLSRILDDLRSALASTSQAVSDSRGVYLLVGVPDTRRYVSGNHVETGESLSEKDAVFNLYGETWQTLIEQSLQQAGLSDAFVATKVVEISSARAPRLLQMAHEALKRDPEGRVVVLTVDTLSDFPGLTWLYQTGRLKTAIHPVGTSPGECVNALILSAVRKAGSGLRIDAVHYDEEANDLFADEPPQGRALARLLISHAGTSEVPWLIGNLTGEQKPSFEWGMVQVHCQEEGLQFEGMPWLPGINVGDVGIAFMSLALSWALQAFARGYALSPRCGIALLDHANERSLISVSRA